MAILVNPMQSLALVQKLRDASHLLVKSSQRSKAAQSFPRGMNASPHHSHSGHVKATSCHLSAWGTHHASPLESSACRRQWSWPPFPCSRPLIGVKHIATLEASDSNAFLKAGTDGKEVQVLMERKRIKHKALFKKGGHLYGSVS